MVVKIAARVSAAAMLALSWPPKKENARSGAPFACVLSLIKADQGDSTRTERPENIVI